MRSLTIVTERDENRLFIEAFLEGVENLIQENDLAGSGSQRPNTVQQP